MPTGYTAGVYDGTITTGKDFLKECLRAFGVFSEYRDESLSPELPTRMFTPSTCYLDRVEESVNELKIKSEWTDEQWAAEYKKAVDSAQETYDNGLKKSIENYEKFDKVYREVISFHFSEKYQHIMDFAIEQLLSGKNHDWLENFDEDSICGKNLKELKEMSVKDYKIRTLKGISSDIDYFKSRYEQDVKAAEDCQDFLDGFLKEIGE